MWGKTVVLPMSGRVVTVVRHEADNDPDLNSAVEMEDHQVRSLSAGCAVSTK